MKLNKMQSLKLFKLVVILGFALVNCNSFTQDLYEFGWVEIIGPDQINTYKNKDTKIEIIATCIDGSNFQYKWDYTNDGIIDEINNNGISYYKYKSSGNYQIRVDVINENNIENFKIIDVTVLEGKGIVTYDKHSIKIADLTTKETSVIGGTTLQSVIPGDGIQKNYAILIGGIDELRWGAIVNFYNVLKNKNSTLDQDIYVLNPTFTDPPDHVEIIDGLATLENIETTFSTISNVMDEDDLFTFFIEWHGNGYIEYDPNILRNIAYHGYFGSAPLISEPNDEQDYLESNLELSLLCGNGYIYGNDYHYGLDQWGLVDYYPYRLYRYKALSHYTNLYVEGLGYISDNDVYIEKFKDYLLGDLDKDGDWDEGENWDYDDDGIPPWDRNTGIFDEDDWGNLDVFTDNNTYWHSSIFKPFVIYDANLDDIMDIDVDATMQTPVNELEVDGSDIDNDGCIEGLDLNDDGDLADWVTINETMSIYGTSLIDDEVKQLLDQLTSGKKLFISNTCFSGGFVNDLSENNTIIITGCSEIEECYSGAFTGYVANAYSTYNSDNNNDLFISVPEAFNYAWENKAQGLPGRFQYDDDGDKISHEYPIPVGSEGNLGSNTSLNAISKIVRPNETLTLSDDYLLNNNAKIVLNADGTLVLDNCNLIIESNNTLLIRSSSNLQILGESIISIKDGGYICIEDAANLTLQDGLSVIILYNGYNTGVNTDVLPVFNTCNSDVQNYSYTGDGSINVFNDDVYVQNTTFTEDKYYTGNNIYIGSDVTDPPYGNVIIPSGVKVIFEANNILTIKNNTIINLGGTIEIRKYNQ